MRFDFASGTSLLLSSVWLGLTGCSLLIPTVEFADPDDASVDADVDGGVDAGRPDSGCPTMCDGECVDTQTDPMRCGSCSRSCTAPENGLAICLAGDCDFNCEPGYDRVVGMCVARDAPRPIAPLSTATVTSRRPTVRWELAPRSDGARVEFCEDRACATVLETVDAPGQMARPSRDLPPGVVFWRLFSRRGTDTAAVPSPVWQFHVGTRSADADADHAWGTTLDINGDGFADVAIGAPSVPNEAPSFELNGAVFVYLGGAGGISTSAAVALSSPDGGRFGLSLGSAGDVNGDGFADLVVGAPGVDTAYVYLGSPDGIASTPDSVLSGETNSNVGSAVASAGDVNADGFGDVIIGATRVEMGAAFLYLGSSEGLRAAPIALDTPVRNRFGGSVASAGDVNGDGFSDIIVGRSDPDMSGGAAYLYLGQADVSALVPITIDRPSAADWLFGVSVRSVGDLNGDGFADIVVGSSGSVSAHLYLGGEGGLSVTRDFHLLGPAESSFGTSASGAGDVNGDGFADLLVGAPRAASSVGASYLYFGGIGGLETPPNTIGSPDTEPSGTFGIAVGSAGDVNGDGFVDIIVGAPRLNSSVGAAYLYLGRETGTASTPTILVDPSGRQGEFGSSVSG